MSLTAGELVAYLKLNMQSYISDLGKAKSEAGSAGRDIAAHLNIRPTLDMTHLRSQLQAVLSEVTRVHNAAGRPLILNADTAQLRQDLAAAQRQLDDLRRSAARPMPMGGGTGAGSASSSESSHRSGITGSDIGRLAAYAAGFVGLGSVIKSTYTQTASFETALNTLGAVGGATAAQLKQASASAIALGGDSTIAGASATDAAVAMTELAKGGLSVTDSMAAAKGTLMLAAAAGVDAATAAGIQANALNAFALKAGDAAKVADILANTANAANGSVTDFAMGLAQSAAVSHQFGLSLTDNQVLLANFAKAGVMGADAGTSLKSMLVNLLGPTKQQAAAQKVLGLTVFDSSGKFEGARALTGQLADAKKKLSQQDFLTAASTAFGTDAVRAASIAADGGLASFDSLTTQINKQGGAALVGGAKMKGLGGSFANLQNQVETAQVTLGEKFSPAIQKVVGGISNAIPKITGFLTGSAMGGGLSKVGDFFKPLVTGAGELISKAWPYVQSFAASVGKGLSSIMGFVRPVADGIGNFFKSFSQQGGGLSVFGTALDGLGKGFSGLMGFIKPIGSVIGDVIGWLGKIPGPVYAGAAALGAFLVLRGPLNAMFLQLIAGYARLGGAITGGGLLASVRALGTGMLTAFGGPVGIAIGLIGGALAVFMKRNQDAAAATAATAQSVADLGQTVDQTTGALTRATAIKIGNDWVADGTAEKFAAIGLDAGTAAAAIVTGGKTLDDYRAKILATKPAQDALSAAFKSTGTSGSGLTKFAATAGVSLDAVAKAAISGGPALQSMATKLAGLNHVSVSAVTEMLTNFGKAADDAIGPLGALDKKAREAGTATGVVAGQAQAAAAATKALAAQTAKGTAEFEKGRAAYFGVGGGLASVVSGANDAAPALAKAGASAKTLMDAAKAKDVATMNNYINHTSDVADAAAAAVSGLSIAIDILDHRNVPLEESQKNLNAQILAIAQSFKDAKKATKDHADSLIDSTGKIKTETAAGQDLFDKVTAYKGAYDTSVVAAENAAGAHATVAQKVRAAAGAADSARASFIKQAESAGYSSDEAAKLADHMGILEGKKLTPKVLNLTAQDKATPVVNDLQGKRIDDKTFSISADASAANATIDAVNARIAAARPISVPVGNTGGLAQAHAAGGTVTGGTPGKDSVSAILMPGEEVISAGPAGRHRGLLKAINSGAMGMAAGGTVPGAAALSGIGAPQYGDRQSNVVTALQQVAQAVADLRSNATDDASKARDALAAYHVTQKKGIADVAAAQARYDDAAKKRKLALDAADQRISQAKTGDAKKAAQEAKARLVANQAITKGTSDRQLAAAQHTAAVQLKAALLAQNHAAVQAAVSKQNAAATAVAQKNLQGAYHTLQATAARYDSITTTLGNARDALAQTRSDRSSAAAGFSSGVQGYDGGLTGHSDTRTTAASVIGGLKFNLSKISAFNADIAKLKREGVRADLLSQLISGFGSGGEVTAHALAMGSINDVRSVNNIQASTVAQANAVGNAGAGAQYDGLIKTQSTQIASLTASQKAATATLDRLARTIDGKMIAAISGWKVQINSKDMASAVASHMTPAIKNVKVQGKK